MNGVPCAPRVAPTVLGALTLCLSPFRVPTSPYSIPTVQNVVCTVTGTRTTSTGILTGKSEISQGSRNRVAVMLTLLAPVHSVCVGVCGGENRESGRVCAGGGATERGCAWVCGSIVYKCASMRPNAVGRYSSTGAQNGHQSVYITTAHSTILRPQRAHRHNSGLHSTQYLHL
jgi:hypothetical protein